MLLYTSANGDPARFLFPISLLFFFFYLSSLCCPSRTTLHSYVFLVILRFFFLLSNLSLDYSCFYLSRRLFIFSRSTCLFSLSLSFFLPLILLFPLVFAFWFCMFFYPSSSNSLSPFLRLDPGPSIFFPLLLFFIPRHPQSHLSRLPFPRPFFFYFTSHLPLSASFESAFPRALFTSRSFSRIVPTLLGLTPESFYPPFLPLPLPASTATFSNSSRCFAVLDLL